MRKAPGPSAPAFYRVLPKPFQDRIGNSAAVPLRPVGVFVGMRLRSTETSWRSVRIGSSPPNHPDDIKHVWQDNHRNYCKGPTMTRMLKPFFGQGLITSEGAAVAAAAKTGAAGRSTVWHSPEMLKLMVETTAAMLARWEATAKQLRQHEKSSPS